MSELDFASRQGAAADAGELRVTPGAVTGLVDRLAKPGSHAGNRTVVTVAASSSCPRPRSWAPSSRARPGGIRAAVQELLDGYEPPQQEAIATFLTGLTDILREQTARLTAAEGE
ncbi:hypothetical protein FHU38_003253 [Saccharomonospora amisosensis]|uniref:Uncharacterized protein n=1 Tax=Saccharomonospora amisosensis TaxID=1128677 RepID=A0A7X5ZRI0_9PSEU|nr:hypothetical protein [Saccharomonospora amisosensis]NIJ12909.1 hypothetical protein [Saccharomonospora amisosensis]